MDERLEQINNLYYKFLTSKNNADLRTIAVEIVQGHLGLLLQQAKRVQELEKENEQLKTDLNRMENVYLHELKVENEQLKEKWKHC